MTSLSRRGLITGLISFVAAPAIVRASSLMPVKTFKSDIYPWVEISDEHASVEIIQLIEKRLAEAYRAMNEVITQRIYSDTATPGGLGELLR